MTISSALSQAEGERLAARIAELEHERKHLLAVIEILKEVSGSLHFIDILQSIARKLGEAFGLDTVFVRQPGVLGSADEVNEPWSLGEKQDDESRARLERI